MRPALVILLALAGCSSSNTPDRWMEADNWRAAESYCASLGGLNSARQFEQTRCRGPIKACVPYVVGHTVEARCSNGATLKFETVEPQVSK